MVYNGIYANIGGILMVNVTIYSIHGSDIYDTQIMKAVTVLFKGHFLQVDFGDMVEPCEAKASLDESQFG